jgi:RNA:NAD 2'-phosphotransferase (TPT1/KptA family)
MGGYSKGSNYRSGGKGRDNYHRNYRSSGTGEEDDSAFLNIGRTFRSEEEYLEWVEKFDTFMNFPDQRLVEELKLIWIVHDDQRKKDRDEKNLDEPVRRLTPLSRALLAILRHDCGRYGLTRGPDGYIDLLKMLQTGAIRPFVEPDQLALAILANPKGRFEYNFNQRTPCIRAVQGHSDSDRSGGTVYAEELGTKVTASAVPSVCVHGTALANWRNIEHEGLIPGGPLGARAQTHFATTQKI